MLFLIQYNVTTGVTKEEDEGNKKMKKIGLIFKQLLTKFWIWVVAITLYGVAITGSKMTAFRIVYMALFLFFVLCFQVTTFCAPVLRFITNKLAFFSKLSFRIWRKIMFAFWVVVIAFSMLILVLVYTYQFDNFVTYWEKYLHISEAQYVSKL